VTEKSTGAAEKFAPMGVAAVSVMQVLRIIGKLRR
jgi:hypothetical protein